MAPLVIGGAFAVIAAAEVLFPLRKPRERRSRRVARNFAVAGVSAAATTVMQRLLLAPLARHVETHRLGLLNQLELPRGIRIAAGVLLLDYTLWWWHWLNHKNRFLWRFHLVHHIDRDLDASTAVRFHFGEMTLSVLYRMLQLRLIGADRQALDLWQTILFVSIFFHHSNVRLDATTDRAISRLVVTPRMHAIHHSDVLEETDSNWSSILTCWDFLHGTFREDVAQETIEIGVPAWQNESDVTLLTSLALPFRPQRDDWRDGNGRLRRSREVT